MAEYKRPVCRGSFVLGSACRKCERCDKEFERLQKHYLQPYNEGKINLGVQARRKLGPGFLGIYGDQLVTARTDVFYDRFGCPFVVVEFLNGDGLEIVDECEVMDFRRLMGTDSEINLR